MSFVDLEWKGGHAPLKARIEALAGFALVGRSRMNLTQDGMIQTAAAQRSMRGETFTLKTVR